MDTLSTPISRNKLKSFKDLGHAQKAKPVTKLDLSKSNAAAQKNLDLARVRGYDMDELLKYDLIDSSYLFDNERLMKRPVKSMLIQEVEKYLSPEDYVSPSHWHQSKTTFLVDVMACIRRLTVKRLNTFGDLCNSLVDYILNIAVGASRIDFVFNTYIENSVKDSERSRRRHSTAVEISCVANGTPLPVDMDSFWSSSNNKTKLQHMLREHLGKVPPDRCQAELVVSGVGGTVPECCQSFHNGSVLNYTDLDIELEEADERLIPHALHATKKGSSRIVILSSDTDVFVLGLFYWKLLHSHGLDELWMRGGIGDTTRYIPLNTLGEKSPELCEVLPAAHALTGCDITSKVGTKHGAIKADPVKYLSQFGKESSEAQLCVMVSKAEEYLVKVLKQGTSCKTMDSLRAWQYHHSKNITIQQLPPTSRETYLHILRAIYATRIQLNCLTGATVDPRLFGFESSRMDDMLLPQRDVKLLPDDLFPSCACAKCATIRCSCRKNCVACCVFCKCNSGCDDDDSCQNPY